MDSFNKVAAEGSLSAAPVQRYTASLSIQKKGMQIKGRLQGLQSNDLGEAMSLLQGLRSMHPSQDCEVFIDNTAVVDIWNKDTLDNPRARLHSTGRALWNRIQLLKNASLGEGWG